MRLEFLKQGAATIPFPLLLQRPDGLIENVYNVKILNKDAAEHEFTISASGLPGIVIDYGEDDEIEVDPGEVKSVPVRIRVPRAELKGGADISVTIRTADPPALEATGKARFLAPTN